MLAIKKSDAMVGAAAVLFAAIMSVTFVTVFSGPGSRTADQLDQLVFASLVPEPWLIAKRPLVTADGGVTNVEATDPPGASGKRRNARSGSAGSTPDSFGAIYSQTGAVQGGAATAAEGADSHDAAHLSSIPAAQTSPLLASVDGATPDRLVVLQGGFGYYMMPGLVSSYGNTTGAGGTPAGPGSGDGTSGTPWGGADGHNGSPVAPPAGDFGGGSGDTGVPPVISPDSPGSDNDPDNGNGGVPASPPIPVPEPPQAPMMLLGLLGMGGLLCLRRRRRRA